MRTPDEALYRAILKVRTYFLGRGVGALEFGPGFLELFEFAHKPVKVEVRHSRSIIDIIPTAVFPQQGPQLFYPLFCGAFVHNPQR